MVTSKNLLAMAFLSDTDPFESAFKQFYQESVPNVAALFGVNNVNLFGVNRYDRRGRHGDVVNRIDKDFFALLEKDRLLGALVHVLAHLHAGSESLSPTLLIAEPTATLARTAMGNGDYDEEEMKKMANQVWSECTDEDVRKALIEDNVETDERYGRIFEASQQKFREALGRFEEYTAWLLEKYPEDEARRNYQLKKPLDGWGFPRWFMKGEFEMLDKGVEASWCHHNAILALRGGN